MQICFKLTYKSYLTNFERVLFFNNKYKGLIIDMIL